MPKKRLFLSIPLSDEFKGFLTDSISQHNFPGKVTPYDNLHITVHFIGDVDETDLDRLIAELESVLSTVMAFDITFSGIRFKKGSGSMIWAVFNESTDFYNLSMAVKEKLGSKDRRVNAHVTLSRNIKGDYDFPLDIDEKVIYIDKIELWESALGGKASVYKPVKKFALRSNSSGQ